MKCYGSSLGDGIHVYNETELYPNSYDIGTRFRWWFFMGFAIHSFAGFFPLIQIYNWPWTVEEHTIWQKLMIVLTSVNLVWYIRGLKLKLSPEARGCFDNGYLLRAKNLTSWFYVTTLPINVLGFALLCCVGYVFK